MPVFYQRLEEQFELFFGQCAPQVLLEQASRLDARVYFRLKEMETARAVRPARCKERSARLRTAFGLAEPSCDDAMPTLAPVTSWCCPIWKKLRQDSDHPPCEHGYVRRLGGRFLHNRERVPIQPEHIWVAISLAWRAACSATRRLMPWRQRHDLLPDWLAAAARRQGRSAPRGVADRNKPLACGVQVGCGG